MLDLIGKFTDFSRVKFLPVIVTR